MMKTAYVLGAALFPLFAHADVLWGRAVAGASLDEIRQVHPGGEEVAPDDKKKLKSGAVLRYRLSGVQIVGEQFDASFYLLNDKLEQVTLSLVAKKENYDCAYLITSVHEALIAKYGEPIKNQRSQLSSQASWTMGKTSVSTHSMNLANVQSCTVWIFYNQRISESSGNL